jgi:uncharacterized RDD family membrane protein YckC
VTAVGPAVDSGTRWLPPGADARQGLRAGVVSRVAAMVVDAASSVALVGVVYLGWAGIRLLRRATRFSWPHPTFTQIVVAAGVVAVLALSIEWSSTGRSVGASFMGLRVLGRRAVPVGFAVAFLRALTCVLFPIGLFWAAFSTRNASLQDLLFRTSVIYDWRSRVPPATVDPAAPEPAAGLD